MPFTVFMVPNMLDRDPILVRVEPVTGQEREPTAHNASSKLLVNKMKGLSEFSPQYSTISATQ